MPVGQAYHPPSTRSDWATPRPLWRRLHAIHGFTLDAAASPDNALLPHYYTADHSGLIAPWTDEIVWCNPPYGKELGEWVQKAADESWLNGAYVTMLLPARTDTRWFHKHVMEAAQEIHFFKGRLKFEGAESSAPFPSMLVHWEGGKRCSSTGPAIRTISP